jgi:hypothetical protein
MSNEIPKWVLNKREYNKKRREQIGYKCFNINVSLEQFDEIDKYLKERNMTRQNLIEKIIEKYK